MNLYLVTRWGNPFDAEGPDAKDTNFLVKAASHAEAGAVVDAQLSQAVTQVEDNREVEGFSHVIKQISNHALGTDTPAIIHGPWYEAMLVQGLETSKNWLRAESGRWEEQPSSDASSL